ncbi:hypothetical protein RJ639_044282 [Escallonia herrerae]|uniref:DUF4283 domain-containing protein n=1 Tax=Escallonia herrerae TaxID=1293975 RepID=A0AA88WBM4_9ASTE|nr:hypothetical protein RJ639_044282 [Escallonia herrerae]
MDLIINQTKSLQCGEFIELEEDEFNASEEGALTLVIKAITNKTIYLKPLQNILLKVWNPSKGMKIQHIQGNTFSVSFNHEWDRKRIMDSRPWSIMSSHLVIRDWPTNCAIDDLSFDYSPFWIRILGLPPMHMTKKNAKKIGSSFGKVLEIDITADGKISWTPDQKSTPFGPWMRAEFDGKCPFEAEWNPLMMGESAEQKTHLGNAAQYQSHMSSTVDASEKSTFGKPQNSPSRVGNPISDKLLEEDLNSQQRGVPAIPKLVQTILKFSV